MNGALSVDLADEPDARHGIFALQVHSGGATEVRFPNFELGPGSPSAAPGDQGR